MELKEDDEGSMSEKNNFSIENGNGKYDNVMIESPPSPPFMMQVLTRGQGNQRSKWPLEVRFGRTR